VNKTDFIISRLAAGNILALLGGNIIYYCKILGVFGGLIHYNTNGSDPPTYRTYQYGIIRYNTGPVSYGGVCYPALVLILERGSGYESRFI
jgi:hypothetical protein